LEECHDHASKHFKLATNGKLILTHERQLSQQMYVCLKQSINKTCALKVPTNGYKPSMSMSNRAHKETYVCMYLKILISRITIDSRSTVTFIRSTL